jgi:hypothetical protein
VDADGRARVVRRMRAQAEACRQLGSPLYADLMDRAAADVDADGLVAAVLDGHEHDPGPGMVALRLFGTVHRLVLSGRAPALAEHYPSAGGSVTEETGEWAWEAFLAVLEAYRDEVREGLDHPPQTNEVGRAAVLAGALRYVVAACPLPVRLVEIGASAGLNLRVDGFRLVGDDGRTVGPADSPVQLTDAWRGEQPPDVPVRIVERRGCDTHPVDPGTPEGRLALEAYVWPDQRERVSRLLGALEVAGRIPAQVEQVPAGSLLSRLSPQDGTVLVVWHSVSWQYFDASERSTAAAELARLGAAATEDAPVARIAFESGQLPDEEGYRFLTTVTTWPGGRERVIGEAEPHGVPATWWGWEGKGPAA